MLFSLDSINKSTMFITLSPSKFFKTLMIAFTICLWRTFWLFPRLDWPRKDAKWFFHPNLLEALSECKHSYCEKQKVSDEPNPILCAVFDQISKGWNGFIPLVSQNILHHIRIWISYHFPATHWVWAVWPIPFTTVQIPFRFQTFLVFVGKFRSFQSPKFRFSGVWIGKSALRPTDQPSGLSLFLSCLKFVRFVGKKRPKVSSCNARPAAVLKFVRWCLL